MTALSSRLVAMTPDRAAEAEAADADPRRRRVLEAAARLLASDGPHALSLRRIAADAGASTQIVYTLFGGKQGLADGLYAEGFQRLATAMREALATSPASGDPERLMAIGRAYRGFAQTEPAFFAVMFGRAIPDFTPTRTTKAHGRTCTYGQLVAEVRACLKAGTLVGGTPDDLARLCWLTAHGLASLEAAGMIAPEDPDAFVERVLRAPLLAHAPS